MKPDVGHEFLFLQNYETDLFFAVKYVKMSWLRWNSNSMSRDTYWTYIPSSKLLYQNIILQKMELLSRSIQRATYVPNLKDFYEALGEKMILTYFWL